MRPLTLPLAEHSRAALQREFNRHQDARYDPRLHCVLRVASGMSCEKTAALFGDLPRIVVNRVRQGQRLLRLVDTRYRLRRPLMAKAAPICLR